MRANISIIVFFKIIRDNMEYAHLFNFSFCNMCNIYFLNSIYIFDVTFQNTCINEVISLKAAAYVNLTIYNWYNLYLNLKLSE